MEYDIIGLKGGAHYLKVSQRVVQAWVKHGVLPHLKLGHRSIRFSSRELDAFLESKRRGPRLVATPDHPAD